MAILTVKKFFLIAHSYSEFHLLQLVSVASCPLAMHLGDVSGSIFTF